MRGQPSNRDEPLPQLRYTLADVVELTSATQNNLIHWTQVGIIQGSAGESAGRGYKRWFSPFNVIEVELAAVINRFGVPGKTIEGALNVFRHFHHGALAVYGEIEDLPIDTEPSYLRLFKDREHRARVVSGFAKGELFARTPARPATQKEADQTVDYVKDMARCWAELRTGSLIRGIPDPSRDRRFLGLFIGGMYAGNDFTYATVALDPRVQDVIEESAIVIDLANVVFRVGERCRKNLINFGRW
ncbi:hypothetical protein BH24ACI5_BH24ACI5_23090 [soil metagenome]